jgi:hypothetical protein
MQRRYGYNSLLPDYDRTALRDAGENYSFRLSLWGRARPQILRWARRSQTISRPVRAFFICEALRDGRFRYG